MVSLGHGVHLRYKVRLFYGCDRGHRAWCYLILAEVIFNTILLHLHTKAPIPEATVCSI